MRIISQYVATNLNAGPKAKVDVERILESNFSTKVFTLKMNGKEGISHFHRYLYLIKKTFFLLKNLNAKEINIIQFPLTNVIPLMNKAKTKIAFVHDLEGLRNHDSSLETKETNFLKTCKYVICHNEKMKEYLIKEGIKSSQIVVLQIFDYLCNKESFGLRQKKSKLTIVYTGNLDKAIFLKQIKEEKMKFILNVYGVGKDNFDNKRIIYKGKYSPDEIVSKIDGDLGLVWDGFYDDALDPQGLKNYTKYNCPHKLSCYLAANMPVIVWDKSAMADFVKNNNIGYTISNIYDINNLDLSDYETKSKNASKIGDRLRTGFYTKKAINTIIDKEKKE